MRMSVLSVEYVRVAVAATSNGAAINPTADTVVMAFPAHGTDPVNGDWKSASWETDATTTPATYYARCLVGPSQTVALSVGQYDVWARISDNPEVPARKAGTLEIV